MNTPIISRCEVWDWFDGSEDSSQCPNSGVLIRETDIFGYVRHRFVCYNCGYEPPYTPPVTREESRFAIREM